MDARKAQDRVSDINVIPVYLFFSNNRGSPYYLITEHGEVLSSGVIDHPEHTKAYARGYVAGLSKQVAIRRQLYCVNYLNFKRWNNPSHVVDVYDKLKEDII